MIKLVCFNIYLYNFYAEIMSRNKRKREKNAKNSPHEKKLKISQKSELTNAVNVNKVERLESPEKCETDVHLYRVIELKNGLKALLMSDVDKDENENIITSKDAEGTASCGLCVGSGSNSDPRNVQGLAHLVGKFFYSTNVIN